MSARTAIKNNKTTEEYPALVTQIVEDQMINADTTRIDGTSRMGAK